MKTIVLTLGTPVLAITLADADEPAFSPVLLNHPEIVRPDHQCPVSASREPLRYYNGPVIKEGHRRLEEDDDE